MKKRFCSMFLFSCMLLLSACGDKKASSPISSISGHCEQSIFLKNVNQLTSAPEGYYCINGGSEDSYLTYISRSSAKQTYLCSKPECSHVADEMGVHGLETCDAYVGSVLLCSNVYHNGYIYVLRYDKATYDVTLAQISADGSVHEDLMVVGQSDEDASTYTYVFVDDATILMAYNPYNNTGEERTVSLEKIDLNKKEKTPVYQYTSRGACIWDLKVLEGQLFFTQVQHADETYAYQLMRYDLKEKRTETVLEEYSDSFTLTDNGQLYYYMERDGDRAGPTSRNQRLPTRP